MELQKIRVIIGTKAQFIKMAPILVELKKRQIPYQLITLGQHKETIADILKNFSLRPPDYTLYRGKDITKIVQVPGWLIACVFSAFKKRRQLFLGQGICLVHGDAFSVLVGAFLAKLFHQKVGLVEAGLRSDDLFNPFPEEITRRLVSWFADYHFCPGNQPYKRSFIFPGKKINTVYNTLLDSLLVVTNKETRPKVKNYCLASIHRLENIYAKNRLEFICQFLEEIARKTPVIFVLHQPTKQALIRLGLLAKLAQNPRIELRPRCDYLHFIKLLWGAGFIITDGGSNQEESYYLGKPCLIMRQVTERNEGIGKTAVLAKYNSRIVRHFVANYRRFQKPPIKARHRPSEIIVNFLETRIS